MIIGARTASWSGKALPYDAEVEFLESTGTQWIDTGTPFSDTTVVQGEFLVRNSNTFIGVYESIQLSRITSRRDFVRKGETYRHPTSFNNEEWHTFSFGDQVYVDDVLCHTYDKVIWTGQAPMFVFALRMQDGSANDFFNGALRWLRIYQSNVIVRDFIPVRVGTVGYMYDRVSGQLFGNLGTGAFVIGEDKTT